MENNNKKTLILSIVGILVLVIAVVGVSFAMFTFTGTGTKENVIKTGTITVDWDSATEDNKIEITNKYPMTDAQGTTQNDNTATFTVEGNWGSQPLTVNYEVGLSDITAGTTLTDQYVKVSVTKDGTYVKGTANSGVTIQSFASAAGPLSLIDSYYITNGTLQNEGSVAANHNMADTFVVRTWVSDAYDLPSNTAQSTAPEVSGGTLQNESGQLHKKTTGSETYSFKVKVVAQQA